MVYRYRNLKETIKKKKLHSLAGRITFFNVSVCVRRGNLLFLIFLILISCDPGTALSLSPPPLYWLNESAWKAGSQALWSNPIRSYPTTSAGHWGINNKQLYHKCLITQHNLLMAPSCSCSHPVNSSWCNRLDIPLNLRNFHALWN